VTELIKTAPSPHQSTVVPSLPAAPLAVRPPMNPDTVSEWRTHIQWWEDRSKGLTTINATPPELIRAQELLEGLLPAWTRGQFWRDLAHKDWKAGLLGAMAQYRTISPTSNAREPNQKVLPPFNVCVRMLSEQSSQEVRDLVYLILQEAEYRLTPTMRQDLHTHFEDVMRLSSPSPLAQATASRLNFRITADSSAYTTAA
jgi:hypothetical protein